MQVQVQVLVPMLLLLLFEPVCVYWAGHRIEQRCDHVATVASVHSCSLRTLCLLRTTLYPNGSFDVVLHSSLLSFCLLDVVAYLLACLMVTVLLSLVVCVSFKIYGS
mmetsp:Transcript_20394/g.31199  ORF Transcript_20394/g.31199 Transcript_20394/m.31199 type:complete len:107 (+) Transcript_20394:325-645(+)